MIIQLGQYYYYQKLKNNSKSLPFVFLLLQLLQLVSKIWYLSLLHGLYSKQLRNHIFRIFK
jgi:hypothetical protein